MEGRRSGTNIQVDTQTLASIELKALLCTHELCSPMHTSLLGGSDIPYYVGTSGASESPIVAADVHMVFRTTFDVLRVPMLVIG